MIFKFIWIPLFKYYLIKGTYLISQAAAKGLIENMSINESFDSLKSYGSIINIASVGKLIYFQ